jgi:uncharacterized membrane protein
MPPTTLLALMLATYAIPIAFVYYKYSTATARSISSIITSKEPFITITDNNALPPVFTMFQTRHFIAACMLLMAVFTIAYEYQRCVTQHTQWSLFAITALLIGIFGVIFIPEHDSTHYIFAATAFFAILGFMVGHTYYGTADADTLRILLYAQILFMVVTVIGVIQDAPIFATEALFLLNFAVFYLYLHGENYTFSISTPSPSPSSSTR